MKGISRLTSSPRTICTSDPARRQTFFPCSGGQRPPCTPGRSNARNVPGNRPGFAGRRGKRRAGHPPTASKTIVTTFQRGFSPANTAERNLFCRGGLGVRGHPEPWVYLYFVSFLPGDASPWCLSLGRLCSPQHDQGALLGAGSPPAYLGVQVYLLSLLSTASFWGGISPSHPSSPPGIPWPTPCLSFPGLNQPVPSTQSLEAEPGFPQHVPVSLPSQGGQPGRILQHLLAQLGPALPPGNDSLLAVVSEMEDKREYPPHLDLALPKTAIKGKRK